MITSSYQNCHIFIFYPMQVVLYSWLGHWHRRGNHHQARVGKECGPIDLSIMYMYCLTMLICTFSCRDEIYIAPSGVQKERIKV